MLLLGRQQLIGGLDLGQHRGKRQHFVHERLLGLHHHRLDRHRQLVADTGDDAVAHVLAGLQHPGQIRKLRLDQHRVGLGGGALVGRGEVGGHEHHLAHALHRRIALALHLHRLADLHLAGLGGRHIHQGPEGAVVHDSRDRLALAHVIAELDRIQVADFPVDGGGDELVAQGGGAGAGLVPALDRLGHVGVPVLGRDRPLLVEKDIALGVDAILERLSPIRIKRGRLLHVVEHEDGLARLHPLALPGQDAHHPAIRLGTHHHI